MSAEFFGFGTFPGKMQRLVSLIVMLLCVGSVHGQAADAPTEFIASVVPTSGPTVDQPAMLSDSDSSMPCCSQLRHNPIYCCLEARRPAFAASFCEDC